MKKMEMEKIKDFLLGQEFKIIYSSKIACSLYSVDINVRIYIATGSEYSAKTDGGFYAENGDCFDKIGKMPIRIDKEEIVNLTELYSLLTWLGTNDGYKFSNEYGWCHTLEDWRGLANV